MCFPHSFEHLRDRREYTYLPLRTTTANRHHDSHHGYHRLRRAIYPHLPIPYLTYPHTTSQTTSHPQRPLTSTSTPLPYQTHTPQHTHHHISLSNPSPPPPIQPRHITHSIPSSHTPHRTAQQTGLHLHCQRGQRGIMASCTHLLRLGTTPSRLPRHLYIPPPTVRR